MSERRRCRRTKIIDTQTLACFTRHRRRNRKARLYASHHIHKYICVCVRECMLYCGRRDVLLRKTGEQKSIISARARGFSIELILIVCSFFTRGKEDAGHSYFFYIIIFVFVSVRPRLS